MSWYHWLLLAYAVVLTGLYVKKTVFPFCDRGHDCFAVPNEEVAKKLVYFLQQRAGLGEKFTFDPVPTHQTVLADSQRVIIWHEPLLKGDEPLPPNGMSIIVDDPVSEAHNFVTGFNQSLGHAYQTRVILNHMPEAKGNLAIVTSTAFLGWVLVFRKHVMNMGPKPRMRRITP
ncbi:MAG: hypothetical protein AAB364_02775 [Patescibacteria group bacterium]